jgi:hypothetical protein
MVAAFQSPLDYWAFSDAVRYQRRFFHDRHVHAFLRAVTASAKRRVTVLQAGTELWRAQLGHAFESREDDKGRSEDVPVPFKPERMKPLIFSASEGRVNPRGIPCLYSASDKVTAVSEVRPWLGAIVSLARMRTARALKLIHCSGNFESEPTRRFQDLPPEETEEVIWSDIGQAFSQPVSPDVGVAEYAATQILAAHIHRVGYDGVVYASSLGPGSNMAFFDLDAAQVAEVSLVSVKAVRYEIGELQGK